MNKGIGPHHVVAISPARQVWLNTLAMSWPAHSIYGLLEVDVTIVRRFIAAHKARTGESLSFTGYLTYCLARAVEEDKIVQSYLKGRKQIVMFDDVDVALMIEAQVGEKRTLMGHVVRAAERKTYRQIHDEIRAVQNAPVPPNRGMPGWFRSAMLLPWPLSTLVKAILGVVMRRDPTIAVAMTGTVGISSVGMFGGGHGGWAVTPGTLSTSLVVGGLSTKPVAVAGQLELREILDLTLVFNHDVIDGAPATRFTRRLVELIESGYGLDEMGEAGAGRTDSRPDEKLAAPIGAR